MSRRVQKKEVVVEKKVTKSKPAVKETPKPAPAEPIGNPIDEIHRAYEYYDQNDNGRIDPYELKVAMQSLGYDSKNPAIYSLVADLDTPESEKAGGASKEDVQKALEAKLGQFNSKENLRRVFDLLVGDVDADVITIDSLKAISKEVGVGLTDDEVNQVLKFFVQGRQEITFDEFYDLMTKAKTPAA